MIPRYTRPEMGRIWSEENRFRNWLTVEVAATQTLSEAGIVPKDAAKVIRERADFDLRRIQEIEAEVRHDVSPSLRRWRKSWGRNRDGSTMA